MCVEYIYGTFGIHVLRVCHMHCASSRRVFVSTHGVATIELGAATDFSQFSASKTV